MDYKSEIFDMVAEIENEDIIKYLHTVISDIISEENIENDNIETSEQYAEISYVKYLPLSLRLQCFVAKYNDGLATIIVSIVTSVILVLLLWLRK